MSDKKQTKKENVKKEAEDEYKTRYLRALADYQNLEKRVGQVQEEVGKRVKRNMVLRLLPFLDNLNKAEVFIQDQGLKMIKDQLMQALEQEGVQELDLEGQDYDPHTAEAIEVVEGAQDNKIVEVVAKGYALDAEVIRPAQVKVSRKAS